MLTLDRIRKTQDEKAASEKNRKDNYKSSSGFTMLSRFMKEKNLQIINEFCDNEQKLLDLLDDPFIKKLRELGLCRLMFEPEISGPKYAVDKKIANQYF